MKVLFLDIDGVRLTPVSESWVERGKAIVRVRCFCGVEFVARVASIRTGNTTSCGCKRLVSIRIRNRKHGHASRSGRHPLYRTWADIVQRCTNRNHPKYQDYGGRGVTVCQDWLASFVAFLAAVGERPRPGLEIDRRNNNGNYEPENVRWATRKEQASNTRVNNLVTHNGRTMTLTAWAEELGWSFMGLKDRARRLPLDEALIHKNGKS